MEIPKYNKSNKNKQKQQQKSNFKDRSIRFLAVKKEYGISDVINKQSLKLNVLMKYLQR